MHSTKKQKISHRIAADDSLKPTPLLNFSGNSDFITETEEHIITQLNSAIATIVSNPLPLTYDNTTGSFLDALDTASLLSSQCTLPALVGSDAAARERSSTSKKTFRTVFDTVFSDRRVYEKISKPMTMTAKQANINNELQRLFERKGVGLSSAEDRAKVAALSSRIGELEANFEQNINENTSSVLLTENDLAGCPASFIASLDVADEDKTRRVVTMKAPHQSPVMKHCTNETTRQRLQHCSQTRCPTNEPMLEELVAKRQERAQLLGWENHAQFMLNVKMAETPERAMDFMEQISSRLGAERDKDFTALQLCLDFDSDKTVVENWDVAFVSRKLKQSLYSLDDEAIREFFPLEHVRSEVLNMYESLLSVEFRQFDKAPAGWHEDVQGFAVLDAETEELLGHFYLDLFSRPGKFGHQCVVPLAPSFVTNDQGKRQLPQCAILGNMTKPNLTTGRPSLLTFSEVKTFFHEFGHVMHAVLTKVDHSLHSWTWPMMPWVGGVQQDYLEVPSMMLEQFVYRPRVLERLSCHFETGAKLDSSTMTSIANAKHFLAGLSYRRFLAFAMFDMIIHQQGKAPFSFGEKNDLGYRDLWALCQTTYWGFAPQDNTHYYTTWYHMAIGYDAGYYGCKS